jgi:hypothetical protein
MLLLVASAPPAVVVNENVAAADALPATRSDAAIANEAYVAWQEVQLYMSTVR